MGETLQPVKMLLGVLRRAHKRMVEVLKQELASAGDPDEVFTVEQAAKVLEVSIRICFGC